MGRCVNCPALLWKNWRQNMKMWKRRWLKLWEERVLTYRSKELYQEALAKGIEQGLANLAAGKYQKGESIEKIADDLLMSTSEVEKLLNHQKEA